MRVRWTPQYNPHGELLYDFAGEAITATVDGEADTFDLSPVPEAGGLGRVMTSLPFNPLLSATRLEGVLEVTLVRWYGDGEDPNTWLDAEEV